MFFSNWRKKDLTIIIITMILKKIKCLSCNNTSWNFIFYMNLSSVWFCVRECVELCLASIQSVWLPCQPFSILPLCDTKGRHCHSLQTHWGRTVTSPKTTRTPKSNFFRGIFVTFCVWRTRIFHFSQSQDWGMTVWGRTCCHENGPLSSHHCADDTATNCGLGSITKWRGRLMF